VNRRKFVQALEPLHWVAAVVGAQSVGKNRERCCDPASVPWKQYEAEAACYALDAARRRR